MKYIHIVILIFFILLFLCILNFYNIIESFDNTLEQSNNLMIKLINLNKPFIITRVGIGAETDISYHYLLKNEINKTYLKVLSNNAGIYNTETSDKCIEKFCELYLEAIKNSAAIAKWENSMVKEQNYFINKYNLKTIKIRTLEPFYIIDNNIKPWSNYLSNKTILIINPFVESFQKQIKNNFNFFNDKKKFIFSPNQKFVFYKSYNTSAGNHIHKNWYETYKLMCYDIKKINFDIALLGCGGYGHPLCQFIYQEMNKSAIYIGGGLQLLFGVFGKRWETNDDVQKILKKNGTIEKMVRPSKEETPKNKNKIENGCYW